MAIKNEWLKDSERRDVKLDTMSDEKLAAEFGFSDYSIAQIRKSAKHIRQISQERINGLRVPTHRAMYLMHAQARKSREYHYLINQETGDIIDKVYISCGSWVDRRPENSYELSLGMSDIPEKPTYRDLLESFVEQMFAQGGQ